MDNDPLRKTNNEINVEEIMGRVREKIRQKHAAENTPKVPRPDAISIVKEDTKKSFHDKIENDFSIINTHWDIHNYNYYLKSHRPVIGKVLVKGRQMVHGEIRRYIDPTISRQTEFNSSIVHILNQTSQKFSELDLHFSRYNDEISKNFLLQQESLIQKKTQEEQELSQKISQQEQELSQKISQQEQELSQKISQQEQELSQKISQQEQELSQKISQKIQELKTDIQNIIDQNLHIAVSEIDKDLTLRAGLAHLLETRTQKELMQRSNITESSVTEYTNYFLFEERFRGSREDIKQRQFEFLQYFDNCSNVLDIGCGRGEFLEILKDNDIGSIGIDIDTDMVSYCKSRQMNVIQSDAILYLEGLEDKSLDGIFIDQVVEHLDPGYLVNLLALCHQKLKFGYYIVIETVNPLSFISFVNFYIDLTHKKPVHPETLQFLVNAAGFRVCEKKFSSPVPDNVKLKKVIQSSEPDDEERMNIEVYNNNIEILNSVLFGPQDYTVIGKKESG